VGGELAVQTEELLLLLRHGADVDLLALERVHYGGSGERWDGWYGQVSDDWLAGDERGFSRDWIVDMSLQSPLSRARSPIFGTGDTGPTSSPRALFRFPPENKFGMRILLMSTHAAYGKKATLGACSDNTQPRNNHRHVRLNRSPE